MQYNWQNVQYRRNSIFIWVKCTIADFAEILNIKCSMLFLRSVCALLYRVCLLYKVAVSEFVLYANYLQDEEVGGCWEAPWFWGAWQHGGRYCPRYFLIWQYFYFTSHIFNNVVLLTTFWLLFTPLPSQSDFKKKTNT